VSLQTLDIQTREWRVDQRLTGEGRGDDMSRTTKKPSAAANKGNKEPNYLKTKLHVYPQKSAFLLEVIRIRTAQWSKLSEAVVVG
jgi:hypothetical protein